MNTLCLLSPEMGSFFLKVTRYLLLLSVTKYNSLQLATYYPSNKVTIIIILQLLKMT